MFRRLFSRSSTLLVRHFSDNKPPKGFEKFFKKPTSSDPLKEVPKPDLPHNQDAKNAPKADLKQEPKPDPKPDLKQEPKADPKPEPRNAEPEKPEQEKPEQEKPKSSKSDYSDRKKKKDFDSGSSFFQFNNNNNNGPFFYIIAGGALAYFFFSSSQPENSTLSFAGFMNEVSQSGKVKYIVIQSPKRSSKDSQSFAVAQDGDFKTIGTTRIQDVSSFVNLIETQTPLDSNGKPLIKIIFQEGTEEESYKFNETLMSFGLQLGLLYVLVMLLNSVMKGPKGTGSGGAGPFKDLFNMNKSNFKVYGVDKKINVSFKDVAGQGQAKKEITEFVEFLKDPEKYKKLGARMPRGALLVGPPGTGKTLLAKASAGEAGVPFITTSGSEFVEMFVGVGASRVRDLFKQAREKAPSIIFIDEIDAVGRKRDDSRFRNDERDTTLNQLLVEMDGFQTDTYVVVMAATNRQDTLDAALLRPGRFDRIVEVTLPDIEGREEILKIHLAPIKLDPNFNINDCAKRVAALTPGFSGADLSQLCNEAAILAARGNKEFVERIDFEKASEKVMLGVESSKKLTPREKKIVSYHEAGHAVAGWFLEGADPVIKVSILPRSKGALGFAQNMPKETPLYTEKEFLDKICMILGGRVSEQIFFGSVTNGASDDLKKATQLAQTLIENFGMGKRSGLVSYNVGERFYSEATKDILESEAKGIIDDCMRKTRELLEGKKELVINLAEKLIEKEGVNHQDLVEILGKRPFEESEEYKKYISEQSSA